MIDGSYVIVFTRDLFLERLIDCDIWVSPVILENIVGRLYINWRTDTKHADTPTSNYVVIQLNLFFEICL